MKCQVPKEEICIKTKRELGFQILPEGLRATLRVRTGFSTQTYIGLISTQTYHQKFSKYFQNLPQFESYLQNKQNLLLDVHQPHIKILLHSREPQLQPITIGTIDLTKKTRNLPDCKEQLKKIMRDCSSEDEWTKGEVKGYLGVMAGIIGEVVDKAVGDGKESKESKEELEDMGNLRVMELVNEKVEELKAQLLAENSNILTSYKKFQNEFNEKISQIQKLQQLNFPQPQSPSFSPIQILCQQLINIQKQLSNHQQNCELQYSQLIKMINSGNPSELVEESNMERMEVAVKQDQREVIEIVDSGDDQGGSQMEEGMEDGRNGGRMEMEMEEVGVGERRKRITRWSEDFRPLIDQKCFNQKKLVVYRNKLYSKGSTDAIGLRAITQKSPTFSIKIHEMGKSLSIGLIDQSETSGPKCHRTKSANLILYKNNRKYLNYCQQGTDGSGFISEEVVTVVVDFQEEKVRWLVGRQLRCVLRCSVLGKRRVFWVPYLVMGEGAVVEFLP